MIGTIEALGVFLLAVLPGFVSLRVLGFRRPPLRSRGALGELGSIVSVSLLGWAALFLWRGQDLLPILLAEKGYSTSDKIDAFVELLALAVGIGLVIGTAARIAAGLVAVGARRDAEVREAETGAESPDAGLAGVWKRLVERLKLEIYAESQPRAAWDKLLVRLVNERQATLCRVKTRSGGEVLGMLASGGWVDWDADGRGVLFDVEMIRHSDGRLRPLENSGGLFVPGEEIATISVVSVPAGPLPSEGDG